MDASVWHGCGDPKGKTGVELLFLVGGGKPRFGGRCSQFDIDGIMSHVALMLEGGGSEFAHPLTLPCSPMDVDPDGEACSSES